MFGLFPSVKHLNKSNPVVVNHSTVSREDRAGHISIRFAYNNKTYYYAVWADRSPDFRAETNDKDAPESKMLLIDNEEEDRFIIGYRIYTYSQYKREKAGGQVSVPTDVPTILEQKKKMRPEKVKEILSLGNPESQVTLYSLDTRKMFEYFEGLKTQELRWKFWSGKTHPPSGFAKCSSTAVRALVVGGIDNLVENWASYLRTRVMIASTLIAIPMLYSSWISMFAAVAASTMLAGALGGAIDAQPLLRAFNGVLNVNGRADSHITKSLISLTGTVCSAVASAVGYDNLAERYFVLPGDVMHLAQQASAAEEQKFILSPPEGNYESPQFT